jgi:hypothetical protein
MRFAFKTSPQNTTWPDMLAVWKEADDIEIFESGWTFDHFYPIVSDSAGPCLEGWMTLAALAQATRRLRLGTLVTGIHYRHPAVLANMAATLDIVSGGRLELGIGAGWNEEESGAAVILRRSRCPATSGWAPTATPDRSQTPRPHSATRAWIWRSSFSRHRTTPLCWPRSPRLSPSSADAAAPLPRGGHAGRRGTSAGVAPSHRGAPCADLRTACGAQLRQDVCDVRRDRLG